MNTQLDNMLPAMLLLGPKDMVPRYFDEIGAFTTTAEEALRPRKSRWFSDWLK